MANMSVPIQLLLLFILPMPIASIAWTFTHEELLREAREWCKGRSGQPCPWYQRKFYYVFTCEYCFSHYVAALFLVITRYHLIYADWRGYLVAWLSLVWVANVYMSLYGLIRLDIKKERVEIAAEEREPSLTGK